MAIGGYLIAGATSVAAASWSGGSTMSTANYELVISKGGQDIVDDMSQGATAGRVFHVKPGFVNKIGTKDNPLVMQLTDATAAQKRSDNTEAYFLYQAAAGEAHVQAYSTNGIDNLIVDSGGLFNAIGGSWGWIQAVRGSFVANPTTQFNYLEIYDGNHLVHAYSGGGNNPTQIDVWGGNVTIKRPISQGAGTINIHGGTVTLEVGSTTDTTVINMHGGTLIHVCGDITTLNHYAGLHDYRRINRESTIGTCVRRPKAKFAGVRSGDLLIVTNDYTSAFPQFNTV